MHHPLHPPPLVYTHANEGNREVGVELWMLALGFLVALMLKMQLVAHRSASEIDNGTLVVATSIPSQVTGKNVFHYF